MKPKEKTFAYVSGRKYDGMLGRCYRITESSYENYGGRGIRVHAEWLRDIEVFRAWMKAELEKIGLAEHEFINNSSFYQLDRIDPDGHYVPENCRLSSPQVNGRNKRASRKRIVIAADGSSITI